MATTTYNNSPLRAVVDVTVGDTWSDLLFSATDLDEDGVEIPADLTGRTYKMQVRVDPQASSALMTLESPDDFILGQSAEAIAYDVEQGNPAGTTKDQLFVFAKPEQTNILPGQWYADLEETGPGDDVYTMYRYTYNALEDVTR